MSAQPCGCDAEADWTCARHEVEREAAAAAEGAAMDEQETAQDETSQQPAAGEGQDPAPQGDGDAGDTPADAEKAGE